MGEFMDAFAVRAPAEQIASSLARYASAHGVQVDVVPGTSLDVDVSDLLLYPSPGGWTVACWPEGGGPPAAAALSRELGTVASVISVYDGDFWTHVLFELGEERDRFASMPDCFEDEPVLAAELCTRWAGNPAVIAAAVNRPVGQISPYLVHESGGDEPEVDERGAYIIPRDYQPTMAFDDDESPIGDPWVFVDFWRRLGIAYPAPPKYPDLPAAPVYGIDFAPGWEDRLPSGAEWTL
jgi:hypothetical protein